MPSHQVVPFKSDQPALDPHNINGRLYAQLDMLLTQLEEGEHVTLKERTAAMLIATRIQYIFMQLRKEKVGDASTGTAVRKYATAFTKADAARGRKKVTRSPARDPDPDDVLGFGDDDDPAA